MENSTVIQFSAFSGLAGALLSQALTGTFQYFGDRRKAHTELKTIYRSKQVEIAESFYYVTSEKMAVIKKNIDYWQNRNNSRSPESLEFLTKEIKKMNTCVEKLDAENWKCGLAGLYFDVYLTIENVMASNARSKELYLHVLDLADTLRHTIEDSRDDLYQLYDDAVQDMCAHYEALCGRMAGDLLIVKSALLNQFNLPAQSQMTGR